MILILIASLLFSPRAEANSVQEAVQVERVRLSDYGIRFLTLEPGAIELTEIERNGSVRKPTVAIAARTNLALHLSAVVHEARRNIFKNHVEAGPLDIVCIKGQLSRVIKLNDHILAVILPKDVKEVTTNLFHLLGVSGRIRSRQRAEIARRFR